MSGTIRLVTLEERAIERQMGIHRAEPSTPPSSLLAGPPQRSEAAPPPARVPPSAVLSTPPTTPSAEDLAVARQLGLPTENLGSVPTAVSTLSDAYLGRLVDEAIAAGKVDPNRRGELVAMGRRDVATLTAFFQASSRTFSPESTGTASSSADYASVARQLGLST